MFIKVVKKFLFAFVRIKKMYRQTNVHEVDHELGVGNWLLLHARGGGIGSEKEQNFKSPGVCPGGGHGYISELNHA